MDVSKLGKPRTRDVLKLTRFLVDKISEVPAMLDVTKAQGNPYVMIQSLVGSVSEEDLLELGKILVGDDSLTEDDLDLAWLTEALAIWAEKVDLPAILKNVKRVARAIQIVPQKA